ncbi:hypothetical protein CORC01_09892, partial [Colletotrichum orchidophilum]
GRFVRSLLKRRPVKPFGQIPGVLSATVEFPLGCQPDPASSTCHCQTKLALRIPVVTDRCPPLEEHSASGLPNSIRSATTPSWSLHGSCRPPQQKTSKSLPMARNFLRHARQDSHVPRFFSDFLPDCVTATLLA